VKEGQTLTDGTNLYTGTLTTAQLNDLANKTLRLGVYREIEGYDDSDGGYVLIATPFVSVDPANVAGMTDDEFDLYRFNQAANLEWENWKQEEGDHYHFNLVSGTGYLYAHETDVTLIFTGEPYSGNGEITLSKTSGVGFEGWNLVGNPFTDTAYIDRPFYVMNSNGTEIIAAADAEQNSIAPLEGVFVEANSDGETITFTTAPQAPQKGGVILNLSKGRGVIDRAIVRFGEGRQLPKFQLRDNSTKVYIPQMGEDFAVVNAETQGEMPVNFKAEENGTYTLTVSESLNSKFLILNYLHLIDNLTGNDVDLLHTPSYSFEARTDDYASRFKLVFATGDANADDNFAFFSNGQIILTGINGNSLLQIIDVTGRVMATYNASSRIATDGLAAGVYVLRLIQGENVKTQKMVIE
jgi:hypothetical protein